LDGQLADGNFYPQYSRNSPKIQPRTLENAAGEDGEQSAPAPAPAAGASGLSTLHSSPLTFQKVAVPVFDRYLDPRSRKYVTFRAGEKTCRAPVYRVQPYVRKQPQALVATAGHLVKVVTGGVRVLGRGRPVTPNRRAGDVRPFSRGSKRRLMRLLAKTDKKDRPLFVTLTYPDIFPDDPQAVKRHLDNIGKRLRRKFPQCAFIWRMEVKPRLSGERAGEIAPHLHLLVWGADYNHLRGFLPLAWFQVVGSQDPKHLVAGTGIEYLQSWRGVMFYAAKYIGKKVEANITRYYGRWWGVIGRANLPLSGVLVVTLTALQAVRATRLGRKYLQLKGKSMRSGLTWLFDGKEMVRYLDFLVQGRAHNAAIHTIAGQQSYFDTKAPSQAQPISKNARVAIRVQ